MSAVRPTVSFSSMNFNEKPHTRRILVAARRRPKLRSFGLTARVDHRRTFCGLCKFVTRFLTTANWYDSKSIARYCAPFPSLSPATGIVRAIPISKLKRPMFRVRNVSLAKTSFPFFIFFSFFFSNCSSSYRIVVERSVCRGVSRNNYDIIVCYDKQHVDGMIAFF